MLYRAFAYICESLQSEVTVFFEVHGSQRSQAVHEHLRSTLASMWHVPPHTVDFYNVFDERELLGDHAFGDVSSGDARLLETGAGGDAPIHYAKPEATLLLVRPEALKRLHAAQQLVSHLQTARRSAHARCAPYPLRANLMETA